MNRVFAAVLSAAVLAAPAAAAQIRQTKGDFDDKFRQLESEIRDPNVYRTASGAPGPNYWQQEVDYKIDATLDEAAKRITATEDIDYQNNSPDTLTYLWVQLDQNRHRPESTSRMSGTAGSDDGEDSVSMFALRRDFASRDIEYGHTITAVTDARGRDLPYVINDTMMRIDLPQPLAPGRSVRFSIGWTFNIPENNVMGGRHGYERFDADDEAGTPETFQYFLAQWFPRLAAYTDYTGWQHKQFLGGGEFTLEFGDYEVALTVPADHIVASTGALQNANQVLTAEQRARLDQARDADSPVYIVTPDEALENEKEGTGATKTWRFKADNVRDFAWASSRKYIWDAMGYAQDDRETPFVWAMSFYPREADYLWSKYSTQAVVHTMEVYSQFSFPYPYPTAQSVNTWAGGGMEYPMITFNGYRPTKDEETGEWSYSHQAKHGLIGVVIHEIGHIYFPMTVNSDERRWTWMDEGINSFLQVLAQDLWQDGGYPRTRGKPVGIVGYMKSENQVPIMTQSDSILQFGNNAYAKPATALNILRETVMGRDLFDHAFREYANRWKFKRPTPEDLFRTLEDASAVDLDWFWRGWFFTTDHVDFDLADVREYQVSTGDPDVEFPLARARDAEAPINLSNQRNADIEKHDERYDGLIDTYSENDEFTVTNVDRNTYLAARDGLDGWRREVLDRAIEEGQYFYFVDVANLGGLVMPLPFEVTFADGSSARIQIPAEIWRRNAKSVTKMFAFDQPATSFVLDPQLEIADVNMVNNAFPRRISRSRIDVFESARPEFRDLIADMRVELRTEEGADEDAPLEPN